MTSMARLPTSWGLAATSRFDTTGLERTVLVSQVRRTTLKPKDLIRKARDIKGVRSRPLGTWVMWRPGQLTP